MAITKGFTNEQDPLVEKPKNTQIDMDDDQVTQQVTKTGSTTEAGNPSGNEPDARVQSGSGQEPTVSPMSTGNDEGESEQDPLADPQWERHAEQQAQSEFNFESYKAKQDALKRRKENQGENAKSIEKFFSSNYNNAAKNDKFGWTGGQLMDSKTRMNYLQAGINADLYSREQLVSSELDNQLAVAREYASLKKEELAQQAYEKAQEQANLRYQISGVYVSPEMTDMLDQYHNALNNPDDDNAEHVMTEVEGYFKQAGLWETLEDADGNVMLDDDGNPEEGIDPKIIEAYHGVATTLQEKQVALEERIAEWGHESALNEMELQYGQDLDGDQMQAGMSPGHGFESVNEDGNSVYWNSQEESWQDKDSFDTWTAENQGGSGEDDTAEGGSSEDDEPINVEDDEDNVGTSGNKESVMDNAKEQFEDPESVDKDDFYDYLKRKKDSERIEGDITQETRTYANYVEGKSSFEEFLDVKEYPSDTSEHQKQEDWLESLKGFEKPSVEGLNGGTMRQWYPELDPTQDGYDTIIRTGEGVPRLKANYDWKEMKTLAEDFGYETKEENSWVSTSNEPTRVVIKGLDKDSYKKFLLAYSEYIKGDITSKSDFEADPKFDGLIKNSDPVNPYSEADDDYIPSHILDKMK